MIVFWFVYMYEISILLCIGILKGKFRSALSSPAKFWTRSFKKKRFPIGHHLRIRARDFFPNFNQKAENHICNKYAFFLIIQCLGTTINVVVCVRELAKEQLEITKGFYVVKYWPKNIILIQAIKKITFFGFLLGSRKKVIFLITVPIRGVGGLLIAIFTNGKGLVIKKKLSFFTFFFLFLGLIVFD